MRTDPRPFRENYDGVQVVGEIGVKFLKNGDPALLQIHSVRPAGALLLLHSPHRVSKQPQKLLSAACPAVLPFLRVGPRDHNGPVAVPRIDFFKRTSVRLALLGEKIS